MRSSGRLQIGLGKSVRAFLRGYCKRHANRVLDSIGLEDLAPKPPRSFSTVKQKNRGVGRIE